jgi:hypothetical protein
MRLGVDMEGRTASEEAVLGEDSDRVDDENDNWTWC